jgi:hypothetical protein
VREAVLELDPLARLDRWTAANDTSPALASAKALAGFSAAPLRSHHDRLPPRLVAQQGV